MCLVFLGVFQFPAQGWPSVHEPTLPGPVSASVFALQGLMHSSGPVGRHRQLVLVLEGELYLIPFALLKGSSSNEYLYERFALIAVPSIRTLGLQSKVRLTEDLWVLHPLLLEAWSLVRLGSKVIKCDLFKLNCIACSGVG